jgi:PPE-repeat protein
MAAELESAANSYRTVIAGLTDEAWQGPAATSMAAAAAPYAAWMSTTAAQAGQAGTQASAAAAAYETAFAMTVPPPVIATNRTQLATLIATNFLGQNTAAIAANEALYGQMWAQDATAMYGYAGSAAAATQLPTFTAPHNNANGGTPSTAPAQAMQTAGSAAAGQALNAATQLAAPAAETSTGAISPGLAFDLAGAVLEVGSVGPFGGIGLGGAFGGLAITLGELAFPEGAEGLGALGGLGLIGQTAPAVGALGSAAGPAGATWASMGKAVPVGSLSVPQAWAAATPTAVREIALVSAQSGAASAAAAAGAAEAEVPFAEMALASMAGRAMAGTASPGRRQPLATQPNATAPPKPADEPEESDKPAKAKAIGVVAELRALVELRDSGVLTQEKFTQRKERLLGE